MWSNYFLFILLLICVFTDLKERKIYNAVLVPFLLTSWIVYAITGGLHGFLEALFGTFVGFVILLIPYLLGGMGAGDVKLLAVIGGIKGIVFVLMASVYMALAGFIMALIVLLFSRGFKERMSRIFYFIHGLQYGQKFPLQTHSTLKTTYPYGIAIAAGALFEAFLAGGIHI